MNTENIKSLLLNYQYGRQLRVLLKELTVNTENKAEATWRQILEILRHVPFDWSEDFKELVFTNIPDLLSYFDMIPTGTFQRCKFLKSITIPAKIRSIHGLAFDSCSNLSEIKIEPGSNLNYLGGLAFSGCDSLNELDLSNTKIPDLYDIFNSSGVHGSIVPKSNTAEICHKKVYLPNTVTSIDHCVFDSVDELIFPNISSIQDLKLRIHEQAFYYSASGAGKKDSVIIRTASDYDTITRGDYVDTLYHNTHTDYPILGEKLKQNKNIFVGDGW